MSSSPTVILFKGDGSEKQPDPYVQELQNIGLKSFVIPVLHFEFISADKILKELQNPEEYSGIIFTSVRAVEAVKKAVQLIEDTDDKISLIDKWKCKENFSVGDTTSAALKSVLQLNSNGKDTGNSEALCSIIVNSFPSSCKPFLYPCSNIRKDSVPDILKASGIQVAEIISYKTTCHPCIQESWEYLIRSEGNPEYLVFFSPSGVEFVIPVLLSMLTDLSVFKFIAIGPSTEKALQTCGQQPWKVAAKPNPKSLCEALSS